MLTKVRKKIHKQSNNSVMKLTRLFLFLYLYLAKVAHRAKGVFSLWIARRLTEDWGRVK